MIDVRKHPRKTNSKTNRVWNRRPPPAKIKENIDRSTRKKTIQGILRTAAKRRVAQQEQHHN